MSCEPKIIREIKGYMYLEEMPLLFNEGVSIKYFLCYVFDELIEWEQKIYFDKSIVIQTTSEKVVRSYNKIPKRILGKKKKKSDY